MELRPLNLFIKELLHQTLLSEGGAGGMGVRQDYKGLRLREKGQRRWRRGFPPHGAASASSSVSPQLGEVRERWDAPLLFLPSLYKPTASQSQSAPHCFLVQCTIPLAVWNMPSLNIREDKPFQFTPCFSNITSLSHSPSSLALFTSSGIGCNICVRIPQLLPAGLQKKGMVENLLYFSISAWDIQLKLGLCILLVNLQKEKNWEKPLLLIALHLSTKALNIWIIVRVCVCFAHFLISVIGGKTPAL